MSYCETDDEPCTTYEHVVTDKYDRGFNPSTIKWAVFSPGMMDELRLATHEQIVGARSPFNFDPGSTADRRRLERARPGDWIRYKEGIAIRLGDYVAPEDED